MIGHSPDIPKERFYAPESPVHAEPGCYVDGSMSLRACTWKAITVVRAFGACDHSTWEHWVYLLENVAEEDGSETYLVLGDQVVNYLNAANLSPDHYWAWDAGSLIYVEEPTWQP